MRRVSVVDGAKIKITSEIASVLEKGEIVVVPTDTSYGLAADATSLGAVSRVFQVKRRPIDNPIHIMVDSMSMGMKYARFSPEAIRLVERFLPGPLTIILESLGNLPKNLTAGKDTVGIRIPKHQIALSLVNLFGKPVTATSANIHGEPDVYSIDDIPHELAEYVEIALDAGRLPKVKPSTIVDLTSIPPKILRTGPIGGSEIFEVL